MIDDGEDETNPITLEEVCKSLDKIIAGLNMPRVSVSKMFNDWEELNDE